MIQLRYYQQEALDALYNYFLTHPTGNPLIALPTGVGKSLLPAAFIQGVMRNWPNQRFAMITHVKELVAQNSEELLKMWPNAPLGIYSAGLKQKDTAHPIVFGGVQSMVKHPDWFGRRDIVFIDEAHLLSGDSESSYQTLLGYWKLANPSMKIVGMTATKYRMGMGLLTSNGIFTDIIYDKTNMEGFNELLAQGYMAPLIPQRTRTELDVSDVSVQQGEFVATQLQGAVDKAEVTYKALQEMVYHGKDRRSWLIFASGIEHAEHIAEQLGAFGVDCAPVHSKRPSEYNDSAIKAFKQGELRAIVNYGKLTTGFNHPQIDLIGMLRPTLSVPLWVQMLGRGTRPAEGKTNCLVLDFARNTPRLGPINDPQIPKMKKGDAGEVPVKICESCGAYNHISARICCQCEEPFTFQQKLISKAGTDELIKSAATEPTPIIETLGVLNAIYIKNEGRFGKPNTLKAMYFTTGLAYTEYVCLEHNGMAGKMARDWWRKRSPIEPPATIDQALHYISKLKCPRFIRVHLNKKYPEILGVEF
jgi:DNA repair protein RadD